MQDGVVWTFYTRTVDVPTLPDRLQVRLSTNGASTNVGSTAISVGDFQTLLLDINPTYTLTDYPTTWTQFTVPVSGVPSLTTGRLAFRYFVENGGPTGNNADYVGIDAVAVTGVPTPTPTPTPSPTPSGPTPTPCPLLTISGTVGQCTTAGPSGIALEGVTITRTGGQTTTTTTDSSGNYTVFVLQCSNPFIVTPSKAARAPSSNGIDTVDVIAIQRHLLLLGTPLSGCRLTAADCAMPAGITTADVIATQRFSLGFSTGIGNVGQYNFTPVNRSYSALFNNQTAQNFDAIVFGDVTAPFANP
jgi:hypothetical protein